MLNITQLLLLVFPFTLVAQSEVDTIGYIKNSYHEAILLDQTINSARDEVAAHRYASKLYYSKLATTTPRGIQAGRVYTVLENGQSAPLEINPSDANLHAGFTSLTITGQRIYYTLYQKDPSGEIAKSQIWLRDKNYQGKWEAAKQMPRWFTQNGNKVSQPATGIFSDSRSEVLFFVSDNDEGKGKQDIWACYVEKDGSFSAPFNLPINTPEEEAAPFFDIGSQALYFSSKGHQSYGGYDVFRSYYLGPGKWSKPENLGRPVNSYYDDLYFSFNENGHHCYFSSDRPSGDCPPIDPACRSFDIYQLKLKATLQLFLFDDHDKLPLLDCNVELMDKTTGKIISTSLNLKNNFTTVGLEPGKKYQIIISKPDYKAEFEDVTSEGLDFFKTGYLELRLKPLKPKQLVKASKPPGPIKDQLVGPGPFEQPNLLPYPEQEKIPNTTVIAYAEHLEPIAPEVLEKGGLGEMPQAETMMEQQEDTEPKQGMVSQNLEIQTEELTTKPIGVVATKVIREEGFEKIPTEEPINEQPKDAGPEPASTNQILEEKTEGLITKTKETAIPPQPKDLPINEEKELDMAAEYLQSAKIFFQNLDTLNYRQVTNMPQISLAKNEDPVDFLLFHNGLKCQVAFDFKNQDFRPDGTDTMNRYLKSIDGLLKKDQAPPIGITFFHGHESQFVVYSFRDANAQGGGPSFIHTFLFPEHYKGILPDPGALIKLLDQLKL